MVTTAQVDTETCSLDLKPEILSSYPDDMQSLGFALSSFSGCFIQITNYKNIDLPYLSLPVLLNLFYSYGNHDVVYPVEVIMNKNFSVVAQFASDQYIKYLESSAGTNYKLLGLWQCKVHISLLPPSYRNSDSMYSRFGRQLHLKEISYLTFHAVEYKKQWKQNLIITTPMYFILVSSKSENYQQIIYHWSQGVWFDEYASVSKYFFVWLTCPQVDQNAFDKRSEVIYSIHYQCPYCNPCKPFAPIYLGNVSELNNPTNMFDRISTMHGIDDVSIWEWFTDLYVSNMLPQKTSILENSRENFINRFDISLENIHFFHRLVDIHILLTIQGNSSHIIKTGSPMYHDLVLWSPKCGRNKYHFNHAPQLFRSYSEHTQIFQSASLIFGNSKSQFVSCHKLETSFFGPLIEIIPPFDTPTWFCILATIVCYLLAIIFDNRFRNITSRDRALYNLFQFLCSLLDQGVNLIQRLSSKSLFQFIAMFPVPLCFMLLGNEYKGDNISRLTFPSPPVPFDTFEKLVKHHFTLRSPPRNFEFYYKHIARYHLDWEGVFGSNHFSYPIVTNYMLELIIAREDLDLPEDIYKKFPNDSKRFLKHSAHFPNWKAIGVPDTFTEEIQNYYNPHLFKCNKSAIIVDSKLAYLIHHNLTIHNMAAYLSKDTMLETVSGYAFGGTVPLKAYKRMQGIGQAGTVPSWNSFNEFMLQLYSNKITNEMEKTEQTDAENMSLLLFFIPIIGLSVSTLIFIIEIRKRIIDAVSFGMNRFVCNCFKSKFTWVTNFKSN